MTSSQSAARFRASSTFLGDVSLVTVQTQAKRDVVVDTGGKRVRLLEDHADKTPNGDRIYGSMIDIFTAEAHMAFESKAAHEVVHPVQATEHRALATPGRSDEGSNGVFLDGNGRVANGLKGPVVKFFDVAVDNGVFRSRDLRMLARAGPVLTHMSSHLSSYLYSYSRICLRDRALPGKIGHQHQQHQNQRGCPGEFHLVLKGHTSKVVDQHSQRGRRLH